MRAKEAGLVEVWLRWELADASQCLLPPSADATGRGAAGAALDLVSFTGSLLLFTSGEAPSSLTHHLTDFTTPSLALGNSIT